MINKTKGTAAVGCSDLLGGVHPELAALDSDLREWYEADLPMRYVPKQPILIQISRLLRRLLDEGDNGKNSAYNGKNPKYDVKP
jgi:hypothetical protein